MIKYIIKNVFLKMLFLDITCFKKTKRTNPGEGGGGGGGGEGQRTRRQELQANNFRANRRNAWPDGAGKHAKDGIYHQTREILAGEYPQKQCGKASDQGAEPGYIQSPELVTSKADEGSPNALRYWRARQVSI